MNRNVLRALAADAFHEVLGNWVFRILAVLALVPILFTFLVGLRPDSVEILFGLKSWSYAELFGAFGFGALPPDPQGTVIGSVLTLFFEFLAGTLGLLLALVATASFVPRMLEKGTADLYFHKPVSRAWLLVSRYFAGLVFIALASGVLVLGTYLGLLLVSGYGEPGVLVAAPQLVYTFALIHSFSVLCGVVTRSTVASILLSSFFFLFNGCIHTSWIAWEQAATGPKVEREHAEVGADGSKTAAEPKERDGEDNDDDDSDADDKPPRALRLLRTALDAVHLVLPKTTDADFFARRLRRALDPPVFQDEDSLVTVFRLERGLERVDGAALSQLAPLDPGAELRAALGEARFAVRSEQGVLHSLWRRAAKTSETRFGERVPVNARALLDQLGLDINSIEDWYPKQLGFTAPLRFNILFSLGSSLA
ncbi:MAG: ABC transporter permease, partial [Planctomycetes bacterium]|nr:ABC transporter permease [Planctomycetota bacterium]